jgi:O-antigen ligase
MANIYYYLIAFFVIGIFGLLMMFSTQNKSQLYIKFILFVYPFISLDFFPTPLSPNLFDFITIIYIFMFYNHRKVTIQNGKAYLSTFYMLTFILFLGIYFADSFTYLTKTALLQYCTIFIYAKILIDECILNKDFIFSVIDYLKIPLIISLIFLVVQLIVGPSFSFDRSQNQNVMGGMSIRYPSFFQDPQKYSQFLAVSSLLLLIRKKGLDKASLYNVLLFVVSITAMMFTGGRAGLGGLLIGILFLVILGSTQYRATIIVASSFLFFILFNYAESLPMFNRVVSLSDDYEFRYSIWQDAFKIYLDHPIFGIGIGNYSHYVSLHNPDQFWWSDNVYAYFDHPESGYLKFLTEMGSIGFISIFILVLLPVYHAISVFRKVNNFNILILIAALLSWLVSFYTLYSFDDTRIKVLIVTIICFLITSYKWADVKV